MVALLAALSATAASDGTAVGQPNGPGAGGNLPDSVLAMVGERPLTRAMFLRARARGTTSPASLTPEASRRFLDLLVDRELVVAGAMPDSTPWSADDSTRYRTLRDRVTMTAALDSSLDAARAWAGSDTTVSLGVLARDSAMTRMNARFNLPLLKRVAKAFAAMPRPSSDSSLAAQVRMLSTMPKIAAADSAAVLARSSAGDYRVSDLLGAWRRLSPAYRPRIDDAGQVRDLAANGLYERALRRAAESGTFDGRPDVAAALRDERESIAAAHLLRRNVVDRIATDDSTLQRRYRKDPGTWAVPPRVRLLRLELPDRREAGRLAAQLLDPAWADTFAARARAGGVSYVVDLSAAGDSALYAAASRAGPGTVLGPDSTDAGWRVARVLAILPGRVPGFAEARSAVMRTWVNEESDRLTHALLDRLRTRIPVVLNQDAIGALAGAGKEGASPRSDPADGSK